MMMVKFRDGIGTVTVEITSDGVNFCDGLAVFDDADGTLYQVPIGDLESVYQVD